MKKIIVKEGETNIEPQVTKEEWLQILLDEDFMSNNYKYALILFFLEPDHKATCKYLAEKHNTSPSSLSGLITQFSSRVEEKLNKFEIVRENGKPNFWLVTMTGQRLSDGLFEWRLRDELIEAIEELDYLSINQVYINDINTLVSLINVDIGTFKRDFAEARKELAGMSRSPNKNILFKYENDTERDWAINEGAGTEVQFHIYLSDNKIGYGLGFNTLYVRFKDDKTPIEYIKPFMDAFIELQDSEVIQTLANKGFKLDKTLEEFKHPVEDEHYLFGRTIEIKDSKISFIDYYNMLRDLKGDLFTGYQTIFTKANELKSIANNNNEGQKVDMRSPLIKEITQLLETNKNVILTGAPGTGKTYLAKQVAQALDATEEFVQFHPSYDYTDFVEGLRPIQGDDGKVGFELRDGIFKAFCKRAIKSQISFNSSNFEEVYALFVDDVIENGLTLKTPTRNKPFNIEVNSRKNCVAIPETDDATRMVLTQDTIQTYLETNQLKDWKPYVKPLGDYIKENYNFKIERSTANSSQKYIIILDEINRAEISKVLGELFFAIDPGYRGKKGRLETQYTNMIPDDDIFKEGFYIPENVYIIGTMNDIDRSVESFDFAMRRRFAWKEIKAEDRLDMWEGEIDEWIDDATWRLQSLNKAIEQVQGLNSAYHVGPAYFLKLANYDGDFETLWSHHLAPLLFEYLRGYPDTDAQLDSLKNAYQGADIDASDD